MTFGQPHWFWAFALFPLLLGIFLRNEALRKKLLRQLVAARLEQRLAGTVSMAKRRLRFALLLLGLACVIASLAEPRLGSTWETSQRKGRDVLVAIDVSKSMLATDLAPNRLARAKFAAQDLISQLGGDRVGLIAFAGSAFLQAPLTADFSAVLTSLGEFDTEIIPRGGTNIAEAIRVAVEAFGKGESDHRALIIITDGEELEAEGIQEAEKAAAAVKIFTVGVGSADGSLIPVPGRGGGGDFVKDESGQIVKSRLDEERLRKIAEVAGGFYVHLQSGPAEMTQIVREGLSKMSEKDIDAKLSQRPIERYQWPLGAGLLVLAASMLIGERRRTASRRAAHLVFLCCALGWLPPRAAASWFGNPGLDHYQAGDDALKAKKNDEARNEFGLAYREFTTQLQRYDSPERNFNLGTAAYKLGRDEEALLSFGKALIASDPKLRVSAEMNLGHTLYRLGDKRKAASRDATLRDWKDSVAHYDAALKIRPGDREIQGYRQYVLKKIKELEEEPPKKDEGSKPPEKKEPSEAAKLAKAKADEAVRNRQYQQALEMMIEAGKTDETVSSYSDYITRLQEVLGVKKTDDK